MHDNFGAARQRVCTNHSDENASSDAELAGAAFTLPHRYSFLLKTTATLSFQVNFCNCQLIAKTRYVRHYTVDTAIKLY
jgi:hypothetical protein